MTLGNELKKYVPAGKTQKAVALELAEALRVVVGLQYSPDTAESRWSEALKGKMTGLRFFFESEQRLETSLSALGVPAGELPRLRQLIRGAMGGQTVLVDLSAVERLTPAVYGELRSWLLSIEGELQVLVGLTDEQYDAAPASFRECGARFERGELTKVREAAAVVVSEDPVRPIEKWLAISFTAPLSFSPANWRERLLEGGHLGELPKPNRPARLIAKEGEARTERLPRGPRLRELMFALATAGESQFLSESYNGRDISSRLALGNLLGVEVESTQEEWDKVRFNGVTDIDPAHLPTMLLASRLTGERLALRVGDKVHLVNPTPETKERLQSLLHASEELVVHDALLDRESYLRELRDAATRLTEDEVFSDPWLDTWLHARFRNDEERIVARDGLVWLSQSKQLKFASSEPVADWRPALRELIAEVPAHATLLLGDEGDEFYCTNERRKLAASASRRAALRAFAPLLVSREVPVFVQSEAASDIPKSSADWARRLQVRLTPRAEWQERQEREQRYFSAVDIDATQWAEADELLARVLDSLSFNVDRAPSRATRDGWVHVLLGGGVVARLQVRPSRNAEAHGSFGVTREGGSRKTITALNQRIATHESDRLFGPLVPVSMRLSGAGLVADLSFSASALLGSSLGLGGASGFEMND